MMGKVLICDDDVDILDMMTVMIEEMGHQVIAVPDSFSVVKRVEDVRPDLVILDLWMPVLAGSDLIKILKSSVHKNQPRILAISAAREGGKIAVEAGADDFLEKPFSYEACNEKIKQLIV